MTEIEQILSNWKIDQPISIKKVETGLLNQTYIIRTLDGLFVLQQLHPAVSLDGCTANYYEVTNFLQSKGNITQTIIPTLDHQLWAEQNSHRWRLIRGIEGEVYTTTPTKEVAYQAGKLLAEFHFQLKHYPTNLHPTLPMFEYDSVLSKLLSYEQSFLATNDPKVIQAFQLLKQEFPKLLLPKNLPQQIIHTDPKISNFLFTPQGQGICMIDLDTIQKLSPLYDIGDCVRSLCGQNEDDPNNTFDKAKYEAIINGYSHVEQTAGQPLLTDTEKNLVPQACELIMLGLASRFLNDYIDDNYFGWNETKYTSRKDHNLARAIGQIALWHSMTQQA